MGRHHRSGFGAVLAQDLAHRQKGGFRAHRTAKGVVTHLDPAAAKMLKLMAVEEATTMQGLMIEAVNMFLASRVKPEIASPKTPR